MRHIFISWEEKMEIANQLGYTGKAAHIVRLLDVIISQNDRIENAQIKKSYLLGEQEHGDDLGIGKEILKCEQKQQATADEITRMDNRGTVRVRIMSDFVHLLGQKKSTEQGYDHLKNQLITLALISVYRMRIKGQSAMIGGMLGFLPTTDRDYSAFRKSWPKLYGEYAQHVRE